MSNIIVRRMRRSMRGGGMGGSRNRRRNRSARFPGLASSNGTKLVDLI